MSRLVSFALLAVVIQIPFELRYTFFGLTNLQWTFVILSLLAAPLLLRNPKALLSNRVIQATALFVGLQWLAASYAPDFHANAYKAAGRFTAGLILLVITIHLCRENRTTASLFALRAWVIMSAAAAIYALAEYAGFGFPWLFRTQEFYVGRLQRLSGSFGYPNVAAAYFAMSLPIVWRSSFRPALRGIFALVLFCALILTFSKGALLALPAIALVANRKAVLLLLAVGAAACAVLLPLNPYLIEGFLGTRMRNPIAVRYTTPWNHLEQQPDVQDTVPLEIHNSGLATLHSNGRLRSAVSYRWWNLNTETFIDTLPIVTELPNDVHRDETLRIDIPFQTPAQPGRYLLVVDLFTADFDWFSRADVLPKLVQVDVARNVSRATGALDLSAIENRGSEKASLTANVGRLALWKAALMMFLDHPFGVGPDNYRLRYGTYLGAPRWERSIYTNNLYLELLTGSGIFGLAAFVLVLAARRWNTDAASLAAAVFLVHGMVDVFLMTTPIYFAFWILMGINSQSGSTASNRS